MMQMNFNDENEEVFEMSLERLKLVTRRLIALLAVLIGFSASNADAQGKPLTAAQVIERIQKHVGLEWKKDTVDTFKAGDPDTPVTGIAVTMMATLDVLKRAAAAGDNLIITHEPTFYSHM